MLISASGATNCGSGPKLRYPLTPNPVSRCKIVILLGIAFLDAYSYFARFQETMLTLVTPHKYPSLPPHPRPPQILQPPFLPTYYKNLTMPKPLLEDAGIGYLAMRQNLGLPPLPRPYLNQ